MTLRAIPASDQRAVARVVRGTGPVSSECIFIPVHEFYPLLPSEDER